MKKQALSGISRFEMKLFDIAFMSAGCIIFWLAIQILKEVYLDVYPGNDTSTVIAIADIAHASCKWYFFVRFIAISFADTLVRLLLWSMRRNQKSTE